METKIGKNTQQKVNKIFENYPLVKYQRGEIICSPKEKCTDVMWVKSGQTKSSFEVGNSKIELSVRMGLFESTVMLTLTDRVMDYTVEAVSAAEIVRVSRTEFVKMLEANKELELELAVGALAELAAEMEISRKLLSLDALGKVAKVVIVVEKSGSKTPLTHKLIGSMTGLTRETVTLQLLKLEKMKLIKNKSRRVMILNKTELQKIAGER